MDKHEEAVAVMVLQQIQFLADDILKYIENNLPDISGIRRKLADFAYDQFMSQAGRIEVISHKVQDMDTQFCPVCLELHEDPLCEECD